MYDSEEAIVETLLEISIGKPKKTSSQYFINISSRGVSQETSAKDITIGFEAKGFRISHHEVWDSFLPLMHIVRNGGPVFNLYKGPIAIRSELPLHEEVVKFFLNRAKNFGIDADYLGETYYRTYDVSTQGDVVLFGGGKDSRLLLGSLRELGRSPKVFSARGENLCQDIPGAFLYDTPNFSLQNRIVPALMANPSRVYHGSGLGETVYTRPWQQYYDCAAPFPTEETSQLLKRLGFDIKIQVPQCILPSNVTQKILGARYPELHRGQRSVAPQSRSEKNLHVSLMERYHGLCHEYHCSEGLLRDLVLNFVRNHTSGKKPDFGFRNYREPYTREICAVLARLAERGDFKEISNAIPESWFQNWIDCAHLYVNPSVDNDLIDIYSDHARIEKSWNRDFPDFLRTRTPIH